MCPRVSIPYCVAFTYLILVPNSKCPRSILASFHEKKISTFVELCHYSLNSTKISKRCSTCSIIRFSDHWKLFQRPRQNDFIFIKWTRCITSINYTFKCQITPPPTKSHRLGGNLFTMKKRANEMMAAKHAIWNRA